MDCEALRTAQCPEKVTCSVRCCVLQKLTACSWDLLAWGSSGSVLQYLGHVVRERFYSARSTELCEMLPALAMLYYLLSVVRVPRSNSRTSRHLCEARGCFLDALYFLTPPLLWAGRIRRIVFFQIRFFLERGGDEDWVYTGDMDLFEFSAFISVFIYFYYKLCPVTDFIIRIVNLLGTESKLIGSFALICQSTVLRPDVVTYLAIWPCQAFSHPLLTTENWVKSYGSSFGICSGHTNTDRVFCDCF